MKRHWKFRAASVALACMRVALGSVLAASMAGVALAQTVPVPRPAPKARDNMARDNTQLSASNAQKRPPLTTGTTAGGPAPPEPFIPDPRRSVPTNLFASFDANQKAQAAKVSNYLSSLQTLVGNFVQVGPDGTKSKGDFVIQKPGKVRFAYDPPTPIDIIADGSSLAVRDRNLATQDIYPLSQTPLRFLLSDRIDLMKDTNVVNVTSNDLFVTVTIEEKRALIGTSRLMLMVGAKDGQLKQWTITDPQGYDTTVAVYNLDSTKKVEFEPVQNRFYQLPDPAGLGATKIIGEAGSADILVALSHLKRTNTRRAGPHSGIQAQAIVCDNLARA